LARAFRSEKAWALLNQLQGMSLGPQQHSSSLSSQFASPERKGRKIHVYLQNH